MKKFFHKRFSSSASAEQHSTVLPFPSAIQFQGRWDFDDGNRYTTWCGSSLHFRTTSRSISLKLGGLTTSQNMVPNVLWHFGCRSETRTAQVNGKRTLVLVPSTIDYVDGPVVEEVTVMLCDWGATLQVLHISASDGRPIIAPAGGPIRPMLFIGGSLVSGFSPHLGEILPHGSFQSFGSITVLILRARGFDTRLEMVAYPGLRLASTKRDEGMGAVFWSGRNGTGGWKHRSKDAPHDIFICIGSSDQGWVDVKMFLKKYKVFLNRLRGDYRACKRIYVISPFGLFYDTSLTERHSVFEPEVQHMIEALAKSWSSLDPGGPKLYHVSTEGWINKSHTCDSLHPNAEGHQIIARRLVEFIDARNSE